MKVACLLPLSQLGSGSAAISPLWLGGWLECWQKQSLVVNVLVVGMSERHQGPVRHNWRDSLDSEEGLC